MTSKGKPAKGAMMSKKAQRIFENTMKSARALVALRGRAHTSRENATVKLDTTGTDHKITGRTLKDILDARQDSVDMTYTAQALGMMEWGDAMNEIEALNVVLRTVNHYAAR